jgi:flagellin-like hook-associated protein FlgL
VGTAIEANISALDAAKSTLRTESSKLSNNLSIITARQEFTEAMINVLKDGSADLTNADMNEEGANMLMLQTRQALGTTSLSLASQAAQSVLRLF